MRPYKPMKQLPKALTEAYSPQVEAVHNHGCRASRCTCPKLCIPNPPYASRLCSISSSPGLPLSCLLGSSSRGILVGICCLHTLHSNALGLRLGCRLRLWQCDREDSLVQAGADVVLPDVVGQRKRAAEGDRCALPPHNLQAKAGCVTRERGGQCCARAATLTSTC